MSFLVNGIEVQDVNFNGNEVKTVYVNNVLVWDKIALSWPGWTDANWGDIYDLCLRRKTTGCDWPSDIQLGISKKITFTESILGSTNVNVYLVGIETEGPGTLTFQTYTLRNTITYCDNSDTGYWSYSLSNLKGIMDSLDGKTSVDDYVIPQDKQYTEAYKYYISGSGVSYKLNSYTLADQKYWIPSANELGFNGTNTSYYLKPEYTVGIDTPYGFKPAISAVYPYWTRTPGLDSSYSQGTGKYALYAANQGIGITTVNDNNYVSFCFTIGYFE